MSIALALQNIVPNYEYIGSLTDENKEAFDALVDLGGVKPSWVDIESEVANISEAEKQKEVEQEVQKLLDIEAQNSGYDNILSACSYAGHTNPFQEEGQAFVTMRGNAWDYCYTELNKIQSGTRPVPTTEAFIIEIKAYLNIGA